MDYYEIGKQAYQLQKEIWYQKEKLLPNAQPRAIDLLKPEIAAQVLGLNYQVCPDLGSQHFSFKGQKFKVAGLIDRQSETIAVIHDKEESMRFTGAHEIGHWILHPNEVMHRDRPISGDYISKEKRPLIEQEADYFAACFLMPKNLLEEYFKSFFCHRAEFPIRIDETVAFYLDPNDSYSIIDASKDSLDRELAFASCTNFGGRQFKSLSQTFGVSNKAMAIRLKELKFLKWP